MAVSLKASKQGLLLVDRARKTLGWKKADPLWCDRAEVAPASLKRFWLTRPIRRQSFINICQAVDVNWELVADAVPPEAKTTATRGLQLATIDWRSVASEMLSERKRLTTNPLTAADGRTFDLDEIYVPMGLVARSQRARLGEDVPPSEGSRLYHPEREKGVLDTAHLEFLLTEGRRLAIIGEPGAGRTTLLQKIAFWVLESTPDIPIWISLADLRGKSLEAYLLQDWLKIATRKIRVTEELQDSLAELFNSGRVWLLLDGLDEMKTDETGPLGAIGPQFTGWIASARILLTCRLNLWDGGKNPLEEFETYRILDFSYGDNRGTPDLIGQFIERWFQSQPELGDSLRRELDQPGHKDLRDMVKNPLRLALLCETWGRWNGKLPGKTELYQQFAKALYDWKQEIFPTTSDWKQKLNKALGRLASQALTEEKIKYRLRHSLVREVLREPDDLLYKFAFTLGWLNVVGIAAENPDELVDAFWHPVFQEYFADNDNSNFQKLELSVADDLPMLLNRNEWLENGEPGITSSMESVMQQHEPWSRELTQEECEKTRRQLKNYSNEFARRRALINLLSLNEFLKLLAELGQQSVRCHSPDKLAILWEFVNGTPIELNKSRLLLVPCEPGEIENNFRFRVPQEWVDIPTWVADYYLPVSVELDEQFKDNFIEFQGLISYTQLKMQTIDLRDRTYLGEENDLEVIEEEMIYILQRNLFGPIIKKVNILPNMSPEQERRLLHQLGNQSIQNPRLKITYEEWMPLAANDECLKYLYHRRIEAATVTSWRERLEKIFDETWQTVVEIIDTIGMPEPSLAFHDGWRDEDLKEKTILELIEILSSSKDKLRRSKVIELLGRNAKGNKDAIACLVNLLNTSTDEDLRREAAVSLGEIDPDNVQGGIKKVKMIDLEPQHKVALMLTFLPGSNRGQMQIYVLVNSVGSEFLPPALEMMILDENGDEFDEITSSTEDNAMQLDLAGEEGDRFTVKLTIGDDSFTEAFSL